MEKFKDVLGYESLYVISDKGTVLSLNYNKTKKISQLKQHVDMNGYYFVTLSNGKKQKSYKVHVLVWEAFYGVKPNGMQINHIDENKSNNSIENLELVSPKDNCNYGTRNQRIRDKLLINHPKANKCIQRTLDGNVVKEFNSIRQAAEFNNLANSSIRFHCANHKPYKGFMWSIDE